jgi:hypothetical protein
VSEERGKTTALTEDPLPFSAEVRSDVSRCGCQGRGLTGVASCFSQRCQTSGIGGERRRDAYCGLATSIGAMGAACSWVLRWETIAV